MFGKNKKKGDGAPLSPPEVGSFTFNFMTELEKAVKKRERRMSEMPTEHVQQLVLNTSNLRPIGGSQGSLGSLSPIASLSPSPEWQHRSQGMTSTYHNVFSLKRYTCYPYYLPPYAEWIISTLKCTRNSCYFD